MRTTLSFSLLLAMVLVAPTVFAQTAYLGVFQKRLAGSAAG